MQTIKNILILYALCMQSYVIKFVIHYLWPIYAHISAPHCSSKMV